MVCCPETTDMEALMARGARKAPAKSGRAGKTRTAAAAKGRSGATRAAAKRRGGSRKSAEQFEISGTVLGLVGALAGSVAGRTMLADVLEAAAGVLRKTPGALGQAAEQGAEAASTVADVATEAATGTVDLAQTAAGVLAGMATSAARSMLPGSSDEDENTPGSRRGRR